MIGAAAHGSTGQVLEIDRESKVRLWGGFHLPSVGLAAGIAYLVAALVHGVVVWGLVGFFATSAYMLTIAAQFVTASVIRSDPERP